MIRTGAGGFVTITKNATDQLDSPYDVPAWASATKYEADQIVHTASQDGTETKFWRAETDHTSKATGEHTDGATNADAGTLVATLWDEIEVGTLYSLTGWTLERTTTETSERILIEMAARAAFGAGPANVTLNFADNYVGQPLQRILSVPNSRVYVSIYPTAKGTGLEVIRGYMRVGTSTFESGTGEERLAHSVTLASSGNFVSSKQE